MLYTNSKTHRGCTPADERWLDALISDDWNGAVYRLTYGLQRVSARH
jgi:hypothetical protein